MKRRMILIVYNEAIDSEIMAVLDRVRPAMPFTKWDRVMGRGEVSEPHLLDHIWPKGNRVVMTCCEPREARELMEGLQQLRRRYAKEGLRAFAWDIDEATD